MVIYKGVNVGCGIFEDKEYTIQEYLTAFLVTFGNKGPNDELPSFFEDGSFFNWHSLYMVGLLEGAPNEWRLTQAALDLIKENKHD